MHDASLRCFIHLFWHSFAVTSSFIFSLGIVVALFGILIFLIVLLATIAFHVWYMIPFVPTPAVVIKGMIDLAKLKPGETVIDLGAGDARILMEASKRQPTIRAIGYEGALGVWLLSKLRIALRGSSVQMQYGDFMNVDLSKADVVFTYLSVAMMKKLKGKFDRELKDGARVISHAFRIPDMSPDQEEQIVMPLVGKSRIYRYVF